MCRGARWHRRGRRGTKLGWWWRWAVTQLGFQNFPSRVGLNKSGRVRMFARIRMELFRGGTPRFFYLLQSSIGGNPQHLLWCVHTLYSVRVSRNGHSRAQGPNGNCLVKKCHSWVLKIFYAKFCCENPQMVDCVALCGTIMCTAQHQGCVVRKVTVASKRAPSMKESVSWLNLSVFPKLL